jgi:S1-C subfamily serine protease
MKLFRPCFAVFALLGIPSLGLGPRLAAQESEDLYEKVVKSCVFIITPISKTSYAMGSGSLIDTEKRYVITNYHVVRDKNDAVTDKAVVYAQFPKYIKGKLDTDKNNYRETALAGKAIKAKVLHYDIKRDLALIQLEKIPVGAPAIPLAKNSPRQGTTVWNIGSPGAVDQVFSITEGKVRSVGIEDHLVSGPGGEGAFRVQAKMVTTTNPTNPGDSGGPLFNRKGHQVGVTESGSSGVQQVNLFVDVTEVRAFLAEKKITFKELSEEPDPKPEEIVPSKGKEKPPVKDKTSPATPEASPADEKAASDKLRSARIFAEGEENRKTYTDKLNAIIKQYPTTAAAKEAKKLLEALK